MATEIVTSTTPAALLAGVALFDDMLREAERLSFGTDDEANSVNIAASERGQPFNPYLLPLLQRLIDRPELATGFAAALGDYVGMLQQGLAPANGPQYEHLTVESITCFAEVAHG